jgi:putative DNA-invertase from lambdoid prophage Rac
VRKVDFASVTEGVDFSTPAGRAMSQILGVFSQFERDILLERIKAGIAEAKEGRAIG